MPRIHNHKTALIFMIEKDAPLWGTYTVLEFINRLKPGAVFYKRDLVEYIDNLIGGTFHQATYWEHTRRYARDGIIEKLYPDHKAHPLQGWRRTEKELPKESPLP